MYVASKDEEGWPSGEKGAEARIKVDGSTMPAAATLKHVLYRLLCNSKLFKTSYYGASSPLAAFRRTGRKRAQHGVDYIHTSSTTRSDRVQPWRGCPPRPAQVWEV